MPPIQNRGSEMHPPLELGTFAFGEPVRRVEQADRTPKEVFVLGVYASAVHARWIVPGRTRPEIQALAVASEPEIFWTGTGASEVVARIRVPDGCGHLEPAEERYNGPSGRTLDRSILAPLGLTRRATWLADLVPHSLVNPQQQQALNARYRPLVDGGKAPAVTCRPATKLLVDDVRRQELLDELDTSKARILILLGDQPIRWFLRPLGGPWRRLREAGTTPETYGRLHRVTVAGRELDVLPLAHPRWIDRLGTTQPKGTDWTALHACWTAHVAPHLTRLAL